MKKSFIKDYVVVVLFFFIMLTPLLITVTSGLIRETDYMSTTRSITYEEYLSYSKLSNEEKNEYNKSHGYRIALPNQPTIDDSINDTINVIKYGIIAVIVVACGCAISNYRLFKPTK